MKSRWGALTTALAFTIGGLLSACSGTGGPTVASNQANVKTATVNIKIAPLPPEPTAKSARFRGARAAHLRLVLASTKSFSVSVTGASGLLRRSQPWPT